MNNFNFTQWIAIVAPLATLYGAMFYVLRDEMKHLNSQHREDIRRSDERWAELLKGFYDFKNVTVERFAKLENKGNK